MRKQKSVWFLILGLLIALAGCGSDGNGRSPMDGMGGDTVDMTALNAAKAAAMAAYDAAKNALADVEANQSVDQASYDKAAEQVEAAKAANDEAQAAETAADAQKYQKMAEDANTEAMKYAGMVTAANDMMANAAKAAAMTAYEAAMAALEAVKDDQSADQASYDKAAGQVEAAKAANDEAQAAETAADAQKYQKMAEDANTEAMKYANMVAAAANRMANAANMAMIEGLTKAIADADGDGQPTGGLPEGAGKRPGGARLSLMAAQGGVLTYDSDNDPGTAANNDELGKPQDAVDDKIEFAKSTQSAASLTGFEARVYERTMTADNGDETTDVLRVYVDSKDAGDVAYFTYFDATVETNAPRPAIVTALTDGATDGKYTTTLPGDALRDEGALTFGTTVTEEDATLFDAAPFRFAEGQNNVTKMFPTAATERTFDGSFAGVPGTYVCAQDQACTTISNKDGRLTTLSAGWTFRPTRAGAEGKVEGVKLDDDYLAYGYWLQTTEKADGSMTYGVNTFANGSMSFDDDTDTTNSNAAIAGLRGTAKYTGKATGMYAMKSFESGAGVPTAAGQFTADASLTANFGGNKVAVDNQFTISGTVNNFRDSDGGAISGGAWSVDLLEAGFSARADVANTPEAPYSNDFTGKTTGGGSWNGAFYGSGTDTDDDMVGIQAANPTGVAGKFNAHLGNGHVIGAFGATR